MMMNREMNQLFLCLPHLQRELGEEAYRRCIKELLQEMSRGHIAVSQMELICCAGGEYSMQEQVLFSAASPEGAARSAVILTDDAGLASFCMAGGMPCCILLDAGSRSAALPNGAYCIEALPDIDAEYLERIYRRAKGLAWDIAQTKRLLLREITLQDVPRLYELYKDKTISEYMEPLYPEPEQELSYTRDYIRNVYGFYGYGMWVIVRRDTGEVIGRAGLEYREGYDGLELGFMLGVEYQHQGYAYEACSAALAYGREYLGQHAFRAIVHEDNAASRRLCERLGFTLRSGYADVPDKHVGYYMD